MDLSAATRETFAPYVGDTFVSTLQDGTELELELTDCTGAPARPGWVEGFSLLFAHASSDVHDQQLHHLYHASLGQVAIFLVPISQGEAGTVYEAVVNRPPGPTP